jgi:hypothetical protein
MNCLLMAARIDVILLKRAATESSRPWMKLVFFAAWSYAACFMASFPFALSSLISREFALLN